MVIIVFLMGVANFYCHRAVLEGQGRLLREFAETMKRYGGGWAGYALEFVFLTVSLWFAREGSTMIVFVYGVYTALNIGGYLMLRRMG
ncbi:hypothetical protein [Parasphingopyxis sp.]|uniref:hypothetical protein n=1 Tax=Parasphingopyxis sp. TaxID=1920299 RepID=UPI0032EFAD8F